MTKNVTTIAPSTLSRQARIWSRSSTPSPAAPAPGVRSGRRKALAAGRIRPCRVRRVSLSTTAAALGCDAGDERLGVRGPPGGGGLLDRRPGRRSGRRGPPGIAEYCSAAVASASLAVVVRGRGTVGRRRSRSRGPRSPDRAAPPAAGRRPRVPAECRRSARATRSSVRFISTAPATAPASTTCTHHRQHQVLPALHGSESASLTATSLHADDRDVVGEAAVCPCAVSRPRSISASTNSGPGSAASERAISSSPSSPSRSSPRPEWPSNSPSVSSTRPVPLGQLATG